MNKSVHLHFYANGWVDRNPFLNLLYHRAYIPAIHSKSHSSLPLIPKLFTKGIWAAACCLIAGLSNCETACCAIAEQPDCAAACCTIVFVPFKNRYHWHISSRFLRENQFIPSPLPDSQQLPCSAQLLPPTVLQTQPSARQSVRRSQSRPLLQRDQHSAPV